MVSASAQDSQRPERSYLTVHNPSQVVVLGVVDRAVREQALPGRRPRQCSVVPNDLDGSVDVVCRPCDVEDGQFLVGEQEEAVRSDHGSGRVCRPRGDEWCIEVPGEARMMFNSSLAPKNVQRRDLPWDDTIVWEVRDEVLGDATGRLEVVVLLRMLVHWHKHVSA